MAKFDSVELIKIVKPKRLVSRVFVHCSASDNPMHDGAETMEQWHLERGFDEIGYHYFINKSGDIQEGRSLEKRPAAQKGHNLATIAICLHGLELYMFTRAQRVSLKALAFTLNKLYGGGLTFHGHCEVSDKECPVFDYRDWLGLDASGRMALL